MMVPYITHEIGHVLLEIQILELCIDKALQIDYGFTVNQPSTLRLVELYLNSHTISVLTFLCLCCYCNASSR